MKFKTKSVTIDGDDYEVRELSARQRKEMFKLYKDETDPLDVQANAIIMGCKKFKGSSVDDLLDTLPGTGFASLAEAVMEVSGLADDSEKDAVKNS